MLLQLERDYARFDVFILRMPVGAGKSRVAHCVASWAGGGTLCTPTNQLVRQYCDTWADLPTLARGSSRGSAAARAVASAPVKVVNYWTYLAHRLYSPLVVFDEAHRLVPSLQDMEQITLWTHLKPVPAWVRTAGDLLVWAEGAGEDKLAAKLRQHTDTYTLEAGVGEYRGHSRSYLRLVPLTPRHNRPVLWPRSVRKLVFMSGTFHAEDLWDLGLEGRRVKVLDCGSPISPDDRPVVYEPVGSLAASAEDRNLPALAGRVRDLLERHPTERGVVHTTYALAAKLRPLLADEPRLRWHSPSTRESVYADWRAEGGAGGFDAPVLVACGMAEGIDLPGALCRWQAVTKLMFPDLSDPAVAAKAAARPAWYAWAAARDLQQAVGRSSRGPGDYSVTYILDSAFAGLYSRHRDMFPVASFQDALHFGGST